MIFASLSGLLDGVTASEVGDQMESFVLKKWSSETPFDLSQQPEGIIILDFFAYWCIPCIQTSNELEHVVSRHYQDKGGNPAGIPVRVVSINVESRMPQKTEEFIEKTGANFVLNNPGGTLLEKLGGKAMPHVVVLQGFEQNGLTVWEIVYQKSGYEGSEKIRAVIDKLSPRPTPALPEHLSPVEAQERPAVEPQAEALEKPSTDVPKRIDPAEAKFEPPAEERIEKTNTRKTAVEQSHETEPPLSEKLSPESFSISSPKGISYTAGVDWLNSSDVSLLTTNFQRRKTSINSEWELNFGYGHIDLVYEPVPEADVIGKPNKLEEGSLTTQYGYTVTMSSSFEVQLGGGAYKGFTDHGSLWLDEYYRQQFSGLEGYVDADPWGFNLLGGLTWDTQAAPGLITASLILAQDDVAPGYDRPLFQPLERGRETLHTGSLLLQQESVLTKTTRIQNQLQFTRTTDRGFRYLYGGFLNQAIGENWVLRAEGAYTYESVEDQDEFDFESHSVGVTLEYDWDQEWFLGFTGRRYSDNGQIETSILISAGPPPLETEHLGITLRRQGENSAWKISVATYSSKFDEVETTIRPFGNLYQNRDWFLLSSSYNFEF